MKKIFIGVSIFIVVIVFGGFYNFFMKGKNNDTDRFKELRIGNLVFQVEIADNSIKQARGLSGRDSLADNRGMLFIFRDLSIRSFWMAGMKFPLDIIWIKGDRVVGFHENLPPASAADMKIYYSPESIDRVLEINAGLVNKLGIRAGDIIEFDQ